MEVNRREIFRYLGYKRDEADDRTRALAESCLTELEQATEPRTMVLEYPLTLGEDYQIDASCFQTRSRNLWKNLKDCEKIAVFAATLGAGADQLIQKYSRLQMSRAVVLQAAATAMLEDYCDSANGEANLLREKKG